MRFPEWHSPTQELVLDIGNDIYEVEKVQAWRVRRKRVQYVIRWKALGPDQDTWEPWKNIEDGAVEIVQDLHKDNPGQERDP